MGPKELKLPQESCARVRERLKPSVLEELASKQEEIWYTLEFNMCTFLLCLSLYKMSEGTAIEKGEKLGLFLSLVWPDGK